MIEISCKKDLYTYNAYHLARAFFPEEEARVLTKPSQKEAVVFDFEPRTACGGVGTQKNTCSGEDPDRAGRMDISGNIEENRAKDRVPAGRMQRIAIAESDSKDAVDKEVYSALSKVAGRTLPWGLLTGVRPTKPAMKKLKEGMGREEFIAWYGREKLVSAEKAGKAYDIAQKELCILDKIAAQTVQNDRRRPKAGGGQEEKNGRKAKAGDQPAGGASCAAADVRKDTGGTSCTAADAAPLCDGSRLLSHVPWTDTCSIYIGIPFCPSICSYCSFSLGTAAAYSKRLDAYTDALCREIRLTADIVRDKKISSIYIGGGTPTSLEIPQLERIFKCINECFDVGALAEFCVEAGRPDSITKEKLAAIKRSGAGRISINPQTMQEATLERIGRAHSTGDVYRAFEDARSFGFDNINMDLIAGLPGEGAAEMADTLEKILALDPESLTVHALSIKRRARMESQYTKGEEVHRMIDLAAQAAARAGLEPYYLYRQKSIAGNFENVGYAKPGKEGIYNILTMEEVQSIYGLGAGANTKVVLDHAVPNPARGGKAGNILRCSNVKDVEEYIKNVEEMVRRKERLTGWIY